jgi:hypothetical protein
MKASRFKTKTFILETQIVMAHAGHNILRYVFMGYVGHNMV